ncbi:MAG TPA: hypothetical protein VGD45_30940 [Steroidobacter sp.]
MNRQTRTAAILRGVFFSSSVLSVTIVTLLWKVVFAPDGGFLANLLEAFGRAPIRSSAMPISHCRPLRSRPSGGASGCR